MQNGCFPCLYQHSGFLVDFESPTGQSAEPPRKDTEQRDEKLDTDGASAGSPTDR